MSNQHPSPHAQAERIRHDLEVINSFNATPGQGITRLTFSPEHRNAVSYVLHELEKTGARVSFTRGGSLRGRLVGEAEDGPAVITGSHLDTVVHGGGYDGPAGVVAALELGRVIAERQIPHRLPIDLVAFAEEEGARFVQGVLGSSIWTGRISMDQISQIEDKEGLSYLEAMEHAGITIDDNQVLTPDKLRAMLEIHIEQGAVLEREGIGLGLVEAIVGIKHYEVTIGGLANHAGTTRMGFRHDAIQGAARIIAAAEEIASNHSHTSVATVGRISAEPNQINVIPGRAKFSLDIRDTSAASLDSMVTRIRNAIDEICSERGLRFDIKQLIDIPPVPMSSELINIMEQKAAYKNMRTLKMHSGAGHDACNFADMTQTGMIFVPSRDGRSHCPEEFTKAENIALAADLLLETVIELTA